MATAERITSLPGRKARAKGPQHPKILGSRTKESQTPPVATSRRRGPQIQLFVVFFFLIFTFIRTGGILGGIARAGFSHRESALPDPPNY